MTATAMFLFKHNYITDVNSVVDFAVGIVSLIIAIGALVIALITYTSIDAVNAISAMDGNVLCNKNYEVAYYKLVEEYEDCQQQSELEDAIFKYVMYEMTNDTSTCMEFSDNIQIIVDRLLWFAYFDATSEKYKENVKKLIKCIDDKYEGLSAISNGNQYVIIENIKLIKNVLNYQSIQHKGSKLDAAGEMLNISGDMLMNRVAKTIYYDYLGLEYLKRAMNYLENAVNLAVNDIFLPETFSKIRDYKWLDEDKMIVNVYLNGAQEAFEKATETSKDDILWKGYILFNQARVKAVNAMINKEAGWDKVYEVFNAAIEARYKVKIMFVKPGSKSFLSEEFCKELCYAKTLLYLLKYNNKETFDKTAIYRLKEEVKNYSNSKIFERINNYLSEINV